MCIFVALVHIYLKMNNNNAQGRRLMNQGRLGEFGPRRNVRFRIPEDGPGCYFKKFSSCGRVRIKIIVH